MLAFPSGESLYEAQEGCTKKRKPPQPRKRQPRKRRPTLALRLEILGHARARMHLDGLADDETILDELANVEARIGHTDFARLVRVKPNSSLSAFLHGGCKAFLQAQRHINKPVLPTAGSSRVP